MVISNSIAIKIVLKGDAIFTDCLRNFIISIQFEMQMTILSQYGLAIPD